MRTVVVTIAVLAASSCSSPLADSRPTPDPDAVSGAVAGCYTVQLGGEPATDVSLPTLIELSRDPAPAFVDPGRLAVREPGTAEPRAPISWWAPGTAGSLALVLGGGYTGYSFSLRSVAQRSWVGDGEYFADFGPAPAPPALPVRLIPRSCS